ncbi:putative transposase like protein [Trichonephila clavipes]|nr:putative transposase like protein [Trichonephila clavipes]
MPLKISKSSRCCGAEVLDCQLIIVMKSIDNRSCIASKSTTNKQSIFRSFRLNVWPRQPSGQGHELVAGYHEFLAHAEGRKSVEARVSFLGWGKQKTQFVRRRDGEKFHSDCVVRTVKHSTKIMIWSVISGKGTGRLDVVKDGAPGQTAWSIKAFLAEQNIPLLDWLGNSPDMNPIGNIWELMKREVAKDVITNKTQL